MKIEQAYCTFTGETVEVQRFKDHKKNIQNNVGQKYGTLWPTIYSGLDTSWKVHIPIIPERKIAEILGVSRVWIRYEGANETGSMKDYLVKAAIKEGIENNSSAFTVVSSGNHAVSLAHYSKEAGKKCVIFVPATTSKLPILRGFENALVIGIDNENHNVVFEDVYNFAQKIKIPCMYNANVNNDFLMTQVVSASKQIVDALNVNAMPTHIVAGVGNGSYVSGMIFGFDHLGFSGIKAVPVGMRGAFPTEEAFKMKKSYHEYSDFLFGEEHISAAEGSIALESYSMPQLMHAVKKSNGFPLGNIMNQDIVKAYDLLVEHSKSFRLGFIPEPTGIMSLAAVLKHKHMFNKSDRLLLSFTGAGYKCVDDLKSYSGAHSSEIIAKIQEIPKCPEFDNFEPINIHASPDGVKEVIMNFLTK